MSESASREGRWVERVGLLALILSLVFVGAELRQTNAAIRGAAYQGLADGYSDFQMMMSESEERGELFRRWWTEPPGDTLTVREHLQVHAILLGLFRNFENTHRQLRVGLISEADAIAFFGFSFIDSEPFARWWGENRRRFSADFVGFVEEVVIPARAANPAFGSEDRTP